jgi:hypothetical protein
MLGTRNSSIFSLIVIVALASPLDAQTRARDGEPSPKLDMTPAQRTFAQSYLAAITGPDIERYKRLLHKRTLACITESNAEFFNTIFERRVRRYTKDPRASVRKLKNAGLIAAARNNGLNYPERPSHAFSIEMISSGANQYSITAFAVRDNGIWYEVLPCPSAKSLDLMRETKHRATADSVKAVVLADSLQEPLRGELLALLTDSGSITAAKRYADATQVDLAMARRVVKALEKLTLEPITPVTDSVQTKPVADSVQNNP